MVCVSLSKFKRNTTLQHFTYVPQGLREARDSPQISTEQILFVCCWILIVYLCSFLNSKLSTIFLVKCQSFSLTNSTLLLSVYVQSKWENFVTVALIPNRLYFFWLPGLHIWWLSEPQALTLQSVGNMLFIFMTLSLILPQQGAKYTKL